MSVCFRVSQPKCNILFPKRLPRPVHLGGTQVTGQTPHREARLSTAAIDVLALVAYRQPATKQEIEAIRGTESGHLLRQLVRRRLIAIVHRGESNQREVSYGTTERFLELFGLKSLDDLPQTQDLQKL